MEEAHLDSGMEIVFDEIPFSHKIKFRREKKKMAEKLEFVRQQEYKTFINNFQ